LIRLVGEPLDVKTWEWVYNDLFHGDIEINNTYGQTETGSAWISSIVDVTGARPGSCGLPLPGRSMDIVDENGNHVDDGSVGTLVIKEPFPTFARGIWNDDQRYRNEYFSIFPGGYCTYDTVVKDHYGHIWVLGRTDDVINVSGYRISTMEMEDVVMSIPEVSDAAVVGIDHDIKGTAAVVFMTLSRNMEISEDIKEKVRNSILEHIGRYAKPEEVYIVPEMTKTRSGKIMRRLLREIVVKGNVSGDITGLEDPDVIERIIRDIK
jgi:acetyl-CoA synthetase